MALYLYFHERLMCFFFAENCFLSRTIGCSKRYAYSKTTRNTRISRPQGNKAFVGWGGLERTKINLLRLLCFRFRKWLVCATYLLYRLDAEILASGSFFQKKVATQNLWIGNGRSRKTKKNKVRSLSNTTEGSRKRRLPQSPFPVSANWCYFSGIQWSLARRPLVL